MSVDIVAFSIEGKEEARDTLRRLLAERLGLEPADVPLAAGVRGKPVLDPATKLADIRFNLSHAQGRALVAIAEGIEVGVDIEQITPRRSGEYLRDWCRREAYLKGTGAGLRGTPRHLSFEEVAPGRWIVIDAGNAVEGWAVIDLDPGESYVAALAAESEIDVSVSLNTAVVDGG